MVSGGVCVYSGFRELWSKFLPLKALHILNIICLPIDFWVVYVVVSEDVERVWVCSIANIVMGSVLLGFPCFMFRRKRTEWPIKVREHFTSFLVGNCVGKGDISCSSRFYIDAMNTRSEQVRLLLRMCVMYHLTQSTIPRPILTYLYERRRKTRLHACRSAIGARSSRRLICYRDYDNGLPSILLKSVWWPHGLV